MTVDASGGTASSGILIIASDPLAAALIAWAVEVAGYVPAFPRPAESARDALRRTKPYLVLVDCDCEDACTESFFGPALMMGARVAVFTSSRSRSALDGTARAFGVQTIGLPVDFDELKSVLDSGARGPAT